MANDSFAGTDLEATMSGDIRMTKKAVIGIVLGVFAVTILGVMLGSWFAGWRDVSASKEISFKNYLTHLGTLETGMASPQVELLDRSGNTVALDDIVSGKQTVILFVSIGCEPCAEAIEQWSHFSGTIPEDMQIIAVNNGDCSEAAEYIASTGMTYPLYCDTEHALAITYGINQYPSVMGIGREGTIIFLGPGVYREFTPIEAYKLFTVK